ncbi:MAG: LysM peptidoglycan-binding domain-containing protein [Chloroflexi bacterium]|nr:MAG: LysM peptidoglycan-binding domain-containing protein [Chloroflexota bacterium]
MKTTKVVSVFVRLLLAAAAFAVLGASVLSAPRVRAAVGDTDDDGIPDAQDNCTAIANADQSDDVSAWIISSSHNSMLYTPQNTWYAPQATSLIYVGDKLQVVGKNYSWSGTSLQVLTFDPKEGEVRVVVPGHSDGRGDKCSPDLGGDFDGIPNSADNCPLIYNPYQENTWGTGLGDVCETAVRPAQVYQASATLYALNDYLGQDETFRESDPLLAGNIIGDNKASSLKVGPHTVAILYTRPSYQSATYSSGTYGGSSDTILGDDITLSNNTVGEDTVSSIRLYSTAAITAKLIDSFFIRNNWPADTVKALDATSRDFVHSIQFWSTTLGFVGDITEAQLVALVKQGSGSVLDRQHSGSPQITGLKIVYNGNYSFTVTVVKLDGATGETSSFYYQGAAFSGIASAVVATPTSAATTAATATKITATAVPAATTGLAAGRVYTVIKGDNLVKIAARYGTTAAAIATANKLRRASPSGRS